jgi:perosamine synthetase
MANHQLKKELPLMIPSVLEKDIEAAAAVLRSGMLIQGKHVVALEKKIQAITGAAHAVAVSNGTATLHLALLALGIGPGDEVIVPAFSYVATANVVELVGATVLFADIHPDTFNIDVDKIEPLITARTKAIIPVHEFGLACDISAIMILAAKHNLHVIEDAACALGATENGRAVGNFGIVGSFSLHPRKSVTSGEGGVITTNDEGLSRQFSIMRNHGIDIVNGVMEFVEAGFNYRMTDFQAAFVNSQLERFNEILQHKQQLAEVYLNELDQSLAKLPVVPGNKNHTWQTFHLVLNETTDRARLISSLKEKGIGTNYGAQCIPATHYYQKKYQHDSGIKFPHAFRAYNKGLAIPLYYNLTFEDVKFIATEINKSIINA